MLNIIKNFVNRIYKSEKEIAVDACVIDHFETKQWDINRWVKYEYIHKGNPTGIYTYATNLKEYKIMTKARMFREC